MHLSISQTWGLIALASYLIGSVPFGYLAGKLRGIDIRQHGSGNIGATNVVRVLGKKIGIPVFVLDFLKGYIPVLLAQSLAGQNEAFKEAPLATSVALVIGALGAVIGHNFTCWLGFKGGKGIATSSGAIFGLNPVALGIALLVWAGVFFTTKYVSLASILAGVILPFVSLTQGFISGRQDLVQLALLVIIATLAVVRHRANIRRLRSGTEPRAGTKPPSAAPATPDPIATTQP